MPETETLRRAQRDKRQGKAPSTQAGEFVRQEMDHIRQGKHGARSAKQAIAIGLSEARRAGVELPPPKRAGRAARVKAKRDSAVGHGAAPRRTKATTARTKDSKRAAPKGGATQRADGSTKRGKASEAALKRESGRAASPAALSRQARSAAAQRSPQSRSAAARKAARTRASQAARHP